MVADIYDWLYQTSLLSDRSLALVEEGLQRPPRQRVRPKAPDSPGRPHRRRKEDRQSRRKARRVGSWPGCSEPPHWRFHALREVPEGPVEVRHAELHVSVRAWRTKAVRYVLEQLAAGVEDSPLAIGPVEPTPVLSQRRLEDLEIGRAHV